MTPSLLAQLHIDVQRLLIGQERIERLLSELAANRLDNVSRLLAEDLERRVTALEKKRQEEADR